MTFEIASTVDLAGLDAAIARLERAQEIVAKYARLIAARMKELAPYDEDRDREPGPHLRDTIAVHLDGFVAEITAGEGLDDIRAVAQEYGFVHYETGQFIQNAYFRAAFEEYREPFERELAAIFKG